MSDFEKEVKQLSTEDLLLIIEDQADLYSDEEMKILKAELSSRPADALERENFIREEAEKAREQAKRKAEQERQVQLQKEVFQNRINKLKAKGYEGYYEYTTLSLADDNSGVLSVSQISNLLNEYALDGWRLVSAYVNELGHNSHSSSFGGYSTGSNSTVDQHILILERFVKID